MTKYILLVLALVSLTVYAQDPNILWQRTIGGDGSDVLWGLEETSDGGTVMAGSSSSGISGEKSELNFGNSDFWVVKLDNQGEIVWQKTIGGSDEDFLYTLKLTLDGGYIVGGMSRSNISGNKTENSLGNRDYWVVKLDANGNIEWQNTIGGSGSDSLTSIVVNPDGTFLLAGTSDSDISADKTEDAIGVGGDFWIIKIDSLGNIIWDNTIGGGNLDIVSSAVKVSSGGYLISGLSFSGISGDKTDANFGAQDYWIVKLNDEGEIVWQKTFGGSLNDVPYRIIETNDSGFLVGGISNSNISGTKSENSQGFDDYWILKLDEVGNIQWQNTIGGNSSDNCYTVFQARNGNYILGGFSSSGISGDKTEESLGESDYWIVNLNSSGAILFQNTIGGSGDEFFSTINMTSSDELLLGGSSASDISGDKTEESRGGYDFWILRYTQILGLIENDLSTAITIYPNPAKNNLQINTQKTIIDQINVYSLTGSKLMQLDVNTVSPDIDVSSLASGIYFIQFYSGKNVVLKKFIKE